MLGDELSERKKLILKAIVESHIECGEPVGSKSLMALPGINCSSATVRNEMAELEELGYLEQPHASAGRVPSQLGYRFYVDQLIERYAMTQGELAQIHRILKAKSDELDQILLAASRLASSLTNYTAIAVKPRTCSASASSFRATFIDGYNFVLIMMMSTGAVVSKHLRLTDPIDEETLGTLVDVLNASLTGLCAEQINLPVIMRMESAMGDASRLVNPIVKTVYSALSEFDGGDLRLTGLNHLLQYPDYGDTGELAGLLDTLERKEDILKLVSEADSDDVSVVIGSESPVTVMSNSSLVFKPIMHGGRVAGVIGVLGPRRMDYARVLETIEQLCEQISDCFEGGLPPASGEPGNPGGGDGDTDG